jgi:hypothetical protein
LITIAYKFTAQVTGATDDDIITASEEIIYKIQDGYTSGSNGGEDSDYSFDLSEVEAD